MRRLDHPASRTRPRARLAGRKRAGFASVLAAAALAPMLLAGCSKQTGGQVVAVVNNKEITQNELRAEAAAEGYPANTDFQSIAPEVLQRVIERTLMAEYARNEGFDRSPEYLAQRRQTEETLLAALSVQKLAGPRKPPTSAEVQAFISANPTLFAGRERLQLDQLRFNTPQRRDRVKELAELNSIDAAEAGLKADKTQYTRVNVTVDTGSLDPSIARQIVALPVGQVFDLSVDGITFLNQIKARGPAPGNAEQWQLLARNILQRRNLETAAGDRLQKMRDAAKITIDDAYKVR